MTDTMLVHWFKLLVLTVLLVAQTQGVPSFDLDDAKVIFFYGSTLSENETYSLDSVTSVLQHPKFIHNRTTFYMNGYNATTRGNNMDIMVSSYFKANSSNLLAVDWQALSNGPYVVAEFNLLRVAPRLADVILDLFAAGVDQETFDVVGLSLGAHGVGLIGEQIVVRSQGKTKLNRITYLEPANPRIHIYILPPLSKDAARFTQGIHGDAGKRGIGRAVAHADFWPNGGTAIQPGCPSKEVNYLCSHLKAGAYYGQSVANVRPEQLLAYRAADYEDFLANKEELMKTAGTPMGANCPSSARGNYYLEIDSDYGTIPGVVLDF